MGKSVKRSRKVQNNDISSDSDDDDITHQLHNPADEAKKRKKRRSENDAKEAGKPIGKGGKRKQLEDEQVSGIPYTNQLPSKKKKTKPVKQDLAAQSSKKESATVKPSTSRIKKGGKRKQLEDEQVSGIPHTNQLPSKKKKTKPVKQDLAAQSSKKESATVKPSTSRIKKGGKRKQRKQLEGEQVSRIPYVRIRTTPKPLYDCLGLLKDQQKEVLREMGFGSLLGMKVDKISGTLGYFVVDNLDASELVLKLSSGPVNINRQAVHNMLGIPMGDTDLHSLPLKESKENEESFLTRWRSQFGGKPIRSRTLCQKISNSNDTGLLFKLNFLMLFASTMMCCDAAGDCLVACQEAIVNRISEDTEIQEIDWCGLLIHYLKTCKSKWPPKDNEKYFFAGPMTFLQLLYLDSTLFETFPIARQRPAIKCWNNTYLKERIRVELEVKTVFGKLPLQPAFSGSVVEEGLVASSGAPKALKEYHSETEARVTNILAKLTQLKYYLKEHLSRFPNDVIVSDFDVGLSDYINQYLGEAKPSSDGPGFQSPNDYVPTAEVTADDDGPTSPRPNDSAHGDRPNDSVESAPEIVNNENKEAQDDETTPKPIEATSQDDINVAKPGETFSSENADQSLLQKRKLLKPQPSSSEHHTEMRSKKDVAQILINLSKASSLEEKSTKQNDPKDVAQILIYLSKISSLEEKSTKQNDPKEGTRRKTAHNTKVHENS